MFYLLQLPTLNHAGIGYVVMPTGYEQSQLRLTNIKGQSLDVRATGNGTSRTVYLHTLPAGQYILQVVHKGQIQSFKIAYLR